MMLVGEVTLTVTVGARAFRASDDVVIETVPSPLFTTVQPPEVLEETKDELTGRVSNPVTLATSTVKEFRTRAP
jgi:hypothetical protein